MCNHWCLTFCEKSIPFINGRPAVLEVGSRDINGSARHVLRHLASSYTGIDIVAGPGVDEVLDVAHLSERYEVAPFDLVVSTEMLEHCVDWKNAIYQILKVLKQDGLLILTTRSPGFELHDYPVDYWRFTKKDMHNIFNGAGTLLDIEDDLTLGWPCGIGIILRKTANDAYLNTWLNGLANYEVAKAGDNEINLSSNRAIIFDQYSRYKACADILNIVSPGGATILDAGSGEGCLLGDFLPNYQITYVDPLLSLHPERAGNKIAGDIFTTELDGQKFDYVVSIDTLEHVPADRRYAFIERICSLSRKGIVLAFPASDAGDAINTDKWINDVYFMAYGKDYPWLAEHFKFQLPKLSEVLDQLKTIGLQTRVTQNGHTPWLKDLLSFILCALDVPSLQPAVRELSNYFNSQLYEFDYMAPAYRQIILATKDILPDVAERDDSEELKKETIRRWEYINKRIIGSPGAFWEQSHKYEEQERQYKQEVAGLEKRLNEVLSSLTWKIGSLLRKVTGIDFLMRNLAARSAGRRLPMRIETRDFRIPKQYDVICLPVIDWFFRFQRPQQMLTQFAGHDSRVFYINLKFMRRRAAEFHASQIRKNIFDISIHANPTLNIYKDNINEADLNSMMGSLEALRKEAGIVEAVCIVHLPFWQPLAKKIREVFGWKIVYDCMDEHAGFSTNNEAMLANEEILAKTCDLLVTTARPLYQKMKKYNERRLLLPNATDFTHFSVLPPNNLLGGMKKPIIGYYGAIADWFDNEIVEYIAENRKDWSFVLIGQTFGSDITKLKKMPNVHFLGEKPYSELPKYLYWFDVCIIPFKLTELILATNPVKFYEFISSGKKVVSVELPELLPYAKHLYLARDKHEFLRKVEEALEEKDSGLASQRIALARENTWEARYEVLCTEIKEVYRKVSIIVVTYNNLDYTKLCIGSIFEKTQYPNIEIVIVDNNSGDGTGEYLKELAGKHPEVRTIFNSENAGFAKANNQGILVASGDYIVLLNNDTIVTRGWLSRLIAHLEDEGIGAVGPVTNSCGNEAKIEVPYKAVEELEEFSERFIREHASPKSFEIRVLAMYCFAARKSLIDKVGLLDERFQVGMFEDDDYAHRIRQKGYRVVCAEDVFIHHFGEASFNKLKGNGAYKKIFKENKRRFEEKWGMSWEPHKFREGKS